MRREESRTHVKANKWPSLSPSSCNSSLRPWAFNENLTACEIWPPRHRHLPENLKCTSCTQKALRISGPGGIYISFLHSVDMPSKQVTPLACSVPLTGVSPPLWKVARIGPEKVLYTKQKPGNHHLLALVLLLRTHRAILVSISYDNPPSVL